MCGRTRARPDSPLGRIPCLRIMTADFDPVAFKETTRKHWQNAAAAWHHWTPTLDAWLRPVTEAMLDLAKLKVGDTILRQDR